MTKHYKLINNSLGWIIGIFASIIYIVTAEPTVSWWDCGEYIATSYKLLVGHPPGAPTFQILGSVFSLFAGGDVTKVAFATNTMSAIASGMTIMFLFWTITLLGKKLLKSSGEITTTRQIALFGAGIVGALTYTFSDTFWFSAVEGEVYALSSFFTALVFWCILKWEEEYDNRYENINPHRWLVLIAYLVGLSIGVHLLNLLTLPAIAMIMYFKLSKKASVRGVVLAIAIISLIILPFLDVPKAILVILLATIPSFYYSFKNKSFSSLAEWGVLLTLGGSFILLGLILYGIIPGIVNYAGKFEIFCVNTIGMPFNVGTLIYFLIIIGAIVWGLLYSHKKKKRILAASLLSFAFLLVGYSTFLTLVIRSNANPTIDENNPEDAVALLSYLNREQYGSNPLFYGESYNSRIIGMEDGTPVYVRDDASKKYIIANDRKQSKYVYHPDDLGFFPRMWSREKTDEYINWLKNQYNPESASGRENIRHLERGKYTPTFSQHKKFMWTYQFDYMYFRYFMWNFSGRQNDIQGRGDLDNGNWITGIPFIDKKLVGKYDELPVTMERPGTNRYYLLPFLLGVIGLIWYSRKDPKNSFVVALLFIMTGLAIAFYLNNYAFQPRERDYAYAASFYAFTIWVGMGVFAFISLIEKIKNKKIQWTASVVTILLLIGLVPGIMAQQNWDDHDRSHRYSTLAVAKNYLDSCAPNAIIFTLGDNDTFPLWYAQEVEGYRTDVRVCNLSLLNTSWYIDQMKRKAYNSEPLPISLTWDLYKEGSREQIVFQKGEGQFVDLKSVVDYLSQSQFNNKKLLLFLPEGYQSDGNPIPGSFSFPVDKEKVLTNGTVALKDSALIVDRIAWNIPNNGNTSSVIKAYLVMMDILAHNNWERPIYFASTTGSEGWFGLEDYFQLEGLAYRLVPIKTVANKANREIGRIDSDILYNNLMNRFNDHSRIDTINYPAPANHQPYEYQWGGINDPRVYNNEDNFRLFGTIKVLHLNLVNQLIKEGKMDKAEKVLDHIELLFPPDKTPYLVMSQIYYSLLTNEVIQGYMNLKTPTGKEKATKIASRFIDFFKMNFDWYARCDERTLQIQSENFRYTVLFLSQMLEILTPEQIDELKPQLKQLDLSSFGPTIVKNTSNKIDSVVKRMRTANPDQIGGLQRELSENLLTLIHIEDAIRYSDSTEFSTFISAEIHKHFDALDQLQPGLGASYKAHLYPDAKVKVEEEEFEELANSNE
jgi:hypothetical protein